MTEPTPGAEGAQAADTATSDTAGVWQDAPSDAHAGAEANGTNGAQPENGAKPENGAQSASDPLAAAEAACAAAEVNGADNGAGAFAEGNGVDGGVSGQTPGFEALAALQMASERAFEGQGATTRAMYSMALAQSTVQAAMSAAQYLQSVSTLATTSMAQGLAEIDNPDAAKAAQRAQDTVAAARQHYEEMLTLALKTINQLPDDTPSGVPNAHA